MLKGGSQTLYKTYVLVWLGSFLYLAFLGDLRTQVLGTPPAVDSGAGCIAQSDKWFFARFLQPFPVLTAPFFLLSPFSDKDCMCVCDTEKQLFTTPEFSSPESSFVL